MTLLLSGLIKAQTSLLYGASADWLVQSAYE